MQWKPPESPLPAICQECAYYDEITGECLMCDAIFGDCALLEAMIIPVLYPDDLDIEGEDD